MGCCATGHPVSIFQQSIVIQHAQPVEQFLERGRSIVAEFCHGAVLVVAIVNQPFVGRPVFR